MLEAGQVGVCMIQIALQRVLIGGTQAVHNFQRSPAVAIEKIIEKREREHWEDPSKFKNQHSSVVNQWLSHVLDW